MAPAVILGVVAIAGAAMKIGSNVIDANAQQSKANATDAAYQENANIKDMQAGEVSQETAFNVMKMNVINNRDIGAQKAGYGVAGVDQSGSALDVLRQSVSMAHADALNTQAKGSYQEGALSAEAAQERTTGSQIQQAGQVNAGKILLGAGSSAASAFPSIYAGIPGGGGGSSPTPSGAVTGASAGMSGGEY